MAGEWRDVALEDVADELTVGFVGPMASEYVDSGIPFLRRDCPNRETRCLLCGAGLAGGCKLLGPRNSQMRNPAR